ncbi:MAG TPA: hypothetical protein PK453_23885 [Leptospiraceae bacterium]|nr:hypothetical protein [Leptospiraceae bacterium]HNF25046.1 hypothetical protein [Leptospiraceae bacterium]HNH08732.1 hypothetical protein [Leptospiraceae bacterium]HNI26546.1 hypothetical protein [Leptospiraceae bacterium]HNI96719.1 hypothetical protein [Leptospiraceae bacterium]
MTDAEGSFSFIALYCSDIYISKKFYEETFSLIFNEEKHGEGPMHFCASLGQSVLELYPAGKWNSSGISFGLKLSGSGRIQRFTDPDGNTVFAEI